MTRISARPRKRLFRSGHAYADIEAILSTLPMKGACLDLPAGSGVNVEGIRNAGFEPVAADLYPEYAAKKGVKAVKADFNELLPFGDGEFAAVLHSEGIEHCPCQLQLLKEFWRVLKPGGSLLITTPNVLNFRSRLSYLLNGHYSFARAPITDTAQIWDSSEDGRVYIGHVFCVTYFALRFMLRLIGFDALQVTTAKYSPSACLMAPFLWLPVRLATGRLLKKSCGKKNPALYAEMLSHAMSADVLLGKKLILLARKPE